MPRTTRIVLSEPDDSKETMDEKELTTGERLGASFMPPRAVTSYEGWRDFVNRVPAIRPKVPTSSEWLTMSSPQRAASIVERQRYHGQLPLIETTTMAMTIKETIQLASVNYNSPAGVRPGFVLDGLGTLGKSTIVMELGRRYELQVRKKFKLEGNANGSLNTFLPVAYVTLPGMVTVKGFNQLLLEFYGIPAPKSSSEQDMAARIVETCRACNTTLILIDDIHFLEMRNRSAQTVNNHLKSLASRISATFGYAGIGVEHSGLLSEGNSEARREFSQTDRRFARYEINRFSWGDQDFIHLLRGFERSLCLVNQKLDGIVDMANYIHDRTDGFIGSVSLLLKLGANLAIKKKTEALTQSLLSEITLDHAAEMHFKAVSGKKKR